MPGGRYLRAWGLPGFDRGRSRQILEIGGVGPLFEAELRCVRRARLREVFAEGPGGHPQALRDRDLGLPDPVDQAAKILRVGVVPSGVWGARQFDPGMCLRRPVGYTSRPVLILPGEWRIRLRL